MEAMNSSVFLLNPQILMDDLEKLIEGIRFYPGENKQTLEGVRFYSENGDRDEKYIYLMEQSQISDSKDFPSEGAYIVLGWLPEDVDPGRASVILIPEYAEEHSVTGGPEVREMGKGPDIRLVFNMCLDIFHRHRSWSAKLQDVVLHRGSIDDLCTISYEYFGNPLFVHDPQLYILSCPIWKEGMVEWERDELTGAISAPVELLNEFKLDSEYQYTLSTSKAQFFSADLRGHRDLYVNLWNDYGGYLGRVVIVELEKPFAPGQMLAAEYLAQLIRDVLLGYGNMQEVYSRAFDRLLENLLKGVQYTDSEVEERVRLLGWRVEDRYVCLTMYSEANADGHFSNISICNYIESTVLGSQAFLLDGKVVVLINTRVNPDYHSVMVELVRDHLYMAGVSNSFSRLLDLEAYYKQAQIALQYCLEKKNTRWYSNFSAISSEYILREAQREMKPEFLCDPILHILDEYDRENGTELLKTLRLYILCERNTVRASKALYIGRSTLFYRLRTITELTGLDGEQMAEPDKNLYLRISFFLWEQIGKK